MNYLFYAPQMAPYGGMERHVCALAAAAARKNHHVCLLTTSDSLGDDLRAELAAAGVVLRELPAARKTASGLRKLRWLVTEIFLARRQPWDVIYTNGQGALARVVWQAGQGRSRCIHHHHTAADRAEQSTWSPGFRGVLRNAPELVACSHATRQALQAATGRTDVRHLPYLTACPVDGSRIAPRAAGRVLHFGYLGRLVTEKGIDTLCRLSLQPALAHIRWHVHGEGAAYPARFFEVWPRVTYHGAFRGAAGHARALLSLDAVVLFSRHNEGLPLSLLEAMSAGLPWIATDRGGTRELAVSAPNCRVVPHPAADPDLAAAVQQLESDIRQGLTSPQAQRLAYDEHFSPACVTARWLAFLEDTRAPAPAPAVSLAHDLVGSSHR